MKKIFSQFWCVYYNFGTNTTILVFLSPGGWEKFFNACPLLFACHVVAACLWLHVAKMYSFMGDAWTMASLAPVLGVYKSDIFIYVCSNSHLLILLALDHRYSLHFGHRTNSLLCTYVPGSQTNNRAVMSGLIKALQVSCLPNNHTFFENIPII